MGVVRGPDRHRPHEPWQSLQLLGSFWWALVVMILVTTLLGYNVDFADLREPADA